MKELDHPHIVKVNLSTIQIFKYYDETFTHSNQQKRYETGLLLELGLDSL